MNETSTSTTAARTSLRNVALEAKVGEITVVLGRNGVGKTTLLKSIMGVVPVKSGTHHARRPGDPEGDLVRTRASGIGFVPQGREIFGRLTVEGQPEDGPGLQVRQRADPGRTVRAVPGAQADAQPPRRRPVGRPATATGHRQSTCSQPEIADPRRADRRHPAQRDQDIGRVLRLLADRKTMAIVLVEQYYDFAAELADQYVVMERGEVIKRGRGADMEADGARQLVSI